METDAILSFIFQNFGGFSNLVVGKNSVPVAPRAAPRFPSPGRTYTEGQATGRGRFPPGGGEVSCAISHRKGESKHCSQTTKKASTTSLRRVKSTTLVFSIQVSWNFEYLVFSGNPTRCPVSPCIPKSPSPATEASTR